MANPITKELETGTIGELLVQLRLLEYGVQSAPPIKDTGNDLIAIKGRVVKFIQVKTSENKMPIKRKSSRIRDFTCLVKLRRDSTMGLLLDESIIKVWKENNSNINELNQELVNEIWEFS